MPRLRLLADTPEGAPGCEVIVSASRARDLVSIGQAEPAPAKPPKRRQKEKRHAAADHR